MVNKEIYIDGVDVSGCEHFSGTYAKECKAVYANSGYKELHDLKCNKSPNCYYKQLKAKEQECEELKEALNEGCLHNLTLMTEQRVLLQTLTEIKEIAESEIDSKEFMAIQCMLNGSVDNKNKVLKQVLQKISDLEV